MQIKVAPSILSADFAKLGEEVKAITEAGADYIHIDVMDGSFVPNITIGPDVIKSLRPHSNACFDVHLMIDNPDLFIPKFAESGADIITFHAEAVVHIDRTIELVKAQGKKVGISLVPSTPENILEYVIDKLDLILVMTVNPGFGGQKFLHSQISKITKIREMITRTGKDIDLQVDGGINAETAKLCIEAGANVFVAGNYIFTDPEKNYQRRINSLNALQ